MLEDEDLLAELPPVRDDEPASLRQDIQDELADHLACAVHRELVKTGNAETAYQRVLDRFGDPRRIALQLWFQAMRSRIMLKRVGLALQVLGVAAVILVGVGVISTARQLPSAAQMQQLSAQTESNRQLLAALLQRLPQESLQEPAPPPVPPAAAPAMMGPTMGMEPRATPSSPAWSSRGTATLVVKLSPVEDDSGRLATEALVAVLPENVGSPLSRPTVPTGITGSMSDGLSRMKAFPYSVPPVGAETQGVLRFTNVSTGRYTVFVEFPDGRALKKRFAILPGTQEHVEDIPCPAPPRDVAITLTCSPLPEDLQEKVTPFVRLGRRPVTIKAYEWTQSTQARFGLILSPKTGRTTQISSPVSFNPAPEDVRQWAWIDVSDLPENQRFVIAKSGIYEVTVEFMGQFVGIPPLNLEFDATEPSDSLTEHVELPENTIALLRKVLMETDKNKTAEDSLNLLPEK